MVGTKTGNREFPVLLVAGTSGMGRNNSRASETYALSQNKKLDSSTAIQLSRSVWLAEKPPTNVIGC
jgi:hypothetical protein